jgi:hypothetical protein
MMTFLLLATESGPTLRPIQPSIQSVPGYPSPGLKRPERDAVHSPPSSADVKNVWSYTFTPSHSFMVWHLIKQWIRLHGVVLS